MEVQRVEGRDSLKIDEGRNCNRLMLVSVSGVVSTANRWLAEVSAVAAKKLVKGEFVNRKDKAEEDGEDKSFKELFKLATDDISEDTSIYTANQFESS
ncbi:hypothetical protein V2J09_019873 [Rumex salicifolius]